MLISAISLIPIDAYSGFEPIELKVSEIDTEFEAPQQRQLAVKKTKKKKAQGFGFGKYGGGHKLASEDDEDTTIKPLQILRATKIPQIQEPVPSSDQKKQKNKAQEPTDVKINEFIKSVVSGGRTSEESENEGWQKTNTNQLDNKREKGKKAPEQKQVYAPKSQPDKSNQQQQQHSSQTKSKKKPQPNPSQQSQINLTKTQSAQIPQTPVFQQKGGKGDNIWASLEIAKKDKQNQSDRKTNSVDNNTPSKAKKPAPKVEAPKPKPEPQQQQQQQQTTGSKKKKKKHASQADQKQFSGQDQQFNALQKVSYDLLNVLRMSEDSQDNPFLLETLATKLAQLYQDPARTQWQQPQQQEETKKQESPDLQQRKQTFSQKELTEDETKFHEMVSAQVCQIVKNFEYKLDSVRKEREAAIAIIDRCVKHVFERQYTSRSGAPIIPVSIKQYGSQASHLAVDSSDVDLAVTGLKLNGDPGLQIYEMRRLFSYLEEVRQDGYILRLDLIETASVPLIKLQIDLQVIQEIARKKALKQAQLEGDTSFIPEPFVLLDETMAILHVDIIFDDYNAYLQQSTFENPQSGLSQNGLALNPFNSAPVRQQIVPSASLAISSVHKIKELQLKYTDLRNIVLIVKKLLAKHNLHKPYGGGLNSYSIVLMTSTFLQKFGINHKSALSQNLSEFFKFFGDFFDPTIVGMDGQKFFNLSPAQRATQEHLIVLDIQNSANNTARSAFRIMDAKRVFSDAYRMILENMHQFEQTSSVEERMKLNVIKQLIY